MDKWLNISPRSNSTPKGKGVGKKSSKDSNGKNPEPSPGGSNNEDSSFSTLEGKNSKPSERKTLTARHGKGRSLVQEIFEKQVDYPEKV